ncbi:hypothetical protein UYA_22630 [Ectopseudomonas alcaliphila JAB1]|nr:hypothetical protein UYA_22630 [Pseudomonas alcaliphila JAB1]
MFLNRLGRKSHTEKAKDDAFMRAIKSVTTLMVKDGCMSMDASELEDRVRASRKAAKTLIKTA